jgi:transposase InsO family protein
LSTVYTRPVASPWFRRTASLNTDQGSQFTGAAFTGVLIKNGIAISMDGKGSFTSSRTVAYY